MDLKEFKVGAPKIKGSTTINHNVRVKLNLNTAEYVLMDYIFNCVDKNKPITTDDTYINTGLIEEEQLAWLNSLVAKGFILPLQTEIPTVTDKWPSAFGNIGREFDEEFWKKDGKVVFPGNKKKSRSYYSKLRKKYSKDTMIEQRNQYLRLISLEHKKGFDRKVMICERFLGPNEEFLNDWKTQADELDKSVNKTDEKPKKTESITAEDRKRAYEQNFNK
jgi:hypothetical protein